MNLDTFFKKVRLWHFGMLISVSLLALGFTGEVPYTDIDLRAGRGESAIKGGLIFFLISMLLIYFPPTKTDDRHDE